MSARYEFIGAEYANVPAEEAGNAPTIVQMCRWLGVSKSGYYEWRSRPQSAAARRRELLKIKIKALFEANDGTYGYRRIHAPNAIDNFCFDVTLSYRRLERPRRVPAR